MQKIFIDIFCFLEEVFECNLSNRMDIVQYCANRRKTFSIRDWENIYQESRLQGILPLTYKSAEECCIYQDIMGQWQRNAMRQIAWSLKVLEEQNELLGLLHNLRPVIIKGAATACYYPNPEYRQMGDIDLVLLDGNLESGKQLLLEQGYVLCEDDRRHISFSKNGIVVELHRRDTHSVKQTEWYDRMDYVVTKADQVQETEVSGYRIPIFEDTYNGLIILTHLLHHMAGGIGLRQLIDWRMYAEKLLTDDYWNVAFCPHAEELDIVDYTKTVTRTCQIYLGLRDDITWCRDVDEKLCESFMEYVMSQGNFGSKADYNTHSMDVLFRSTGMKNLFMNLQRQGRYNWKALRKYPWLSPFAWMYQGIRYMRLGFGHNISISDLKKEKDVKKELASLFEKMGLKNGGRKM